MADRLIFVRPQRTGLSLLCTTLARPAAWCCVLLLAGRLVLAQEEVAIHDPALAPMPTPVLPVEHDADLLVGLEKGRQALLARNFLVARHWLWIGAEQGNPESQFLLASLYRLGLGVDRDPSVAAEWLRQAAQQGHAGAQNGLGELFRDGLGVENDDTEAAWWFRRAAEQGLADAQVSLGALSLLGRGLRQDDEAAARWFQLAAEQGHAAGQYYFGVSMAEGRGIVADPVLAHRWLEKSAAQGHRSAHDYLAAIDAGKGATFATNSTGK